MKKCIIPGTFDPITNGHIDVIRRSAKIMDQVVVAVAKSEKKIPIFTLEERLEMVKSSCKNFENVFVESFSGLLVDFAKDKEINCLIKGLRAVTDFEYEFQMAALNYKLDKNLETCFVMSSPEYMYLSSSQVRELASMGGDTGSLVPQCVYEALQKKYKKI